MIEILTFMTVAALSIVIIKNNNMRYYNGDKRNKQ